MQTTSRSTTSWTTTLSQYAPKALAVLRIMTGLLFIQTGTQKLFGWPTAPMEMPPLDPLLMTAGILELAGGLLIVLGLFTRPTAFILSGFMAVAYFMGHAPMGFFPASNMGGFAILYCFVFLYLFFAGPGDWSVDGMRHRA
ncbi:DoxX family protein [Pelagibacterium sp. H642]|uniref:DoxX family protein n=1 Tax=Pelagibacterium sp. H642 TaxID=1881069 RepID=UPI002814ECAC|nr:DoxX family protein [Pelagibacterium sp. H642]WMT89312.1 DoxX family protein [Pelagibacterium sp. H642]